MGGQGLQAATGPAVPLLHAWPTCVEGVVGQMQGPQHRCGQQREEGISFAGLGARTLGPAAAPGSSAGFK